MTIKKTIIAAALAAPAMMALAAPAQAQVTGNIATASQIRAVVASKAFTASNTAINTTFKSALDQITARRTAEQNELMPLITSLDTNGDKQLSDQELQTAQTAKNPAIAKIQTAQQNAERDIARLQQPVLLAQAYATELILQQYEGAQNRVVQAKKIVALLTPDSFLYAPDSVDVTAAITAELDKAIPSAPITPPAGWQPQQGTLMFLQNLNQIAQESAARRPRGTAPAPAAAAPAAGAPRPAATPQTPPPGR